MIFKHFRLNVVIRVLLLAGSLALLEYVWEQDNWPMTKIFVGLCVVGLVAELIYYVEKTNRDLRAFLLAIKHKDFTHTFTGEQQGRSFAGLKDAFNQIIQGYQELRAEKESHYQYLQYVIEHVSVSLLCFGTEGEVKLMNQAAKVLLDRPFMSNLEILKRVDPVLLDKIKDLGNGQRALVKVVIQDELRHIALQAKEFKLQGVAYKLVSLQDIRSELDEKEVDTWQKLIRVLTHEIMNSVTPIISLAKVINLLMSDEAGQRKDLCDIDPEDADDMLSGIRTIESRSKGLLHFVHAYRSLTKIQKPRFARIYARDIMEQVVTLLKPELERRRIEVHCQGLPDYPYIQADAELIEQVLINLVKNAMEALEGRENGRIDLLAGKFQDERLYIQVKDNGPGIDEEYVDRIFIPFFTTKRKGSGIGLSLSRQIMRMHKGSINLYSNPHEGTTFTLVF